MSSDARANSALSSKLSVVLVSSGLGTIAVVAAVKAATMLAGHPLHAVSDVLASLPGVGLIGLCTVCLLALVEFLERVVHLDAEYARKVAHVGAGVILCFAPALFPTSWPVLCLALFFTLVFVLNRRFRLVTSLHTRSRHSVGDLVYPAGIYVTFLLAEGKWLLFLPAVLVLAISDTSAALIGQRYGRHRYLVMGSSRSLEGSTAFAVTAFLVIFLVLSCVGSIGDVKCVAIAVATAIPVAVVEAVSPRGLDNLLAPVTAVLLLSAAISVLGLPT